MYTMWPCPSPQTHTHPKVLSRIHNGAAQDRVHPQHLQPCAPSPSFSSGFGNKDPGKNQCRGDTQPVHEQGCHPSLGKGRHDPRAPCSALGLTVRCPKSADLSKGASSPCLGLPVTEDGALGEDPGHWEDAPGWQPPLGTTGRGPCARPSPLLSPKHPDLAQRVFFRARSMSPPQPTSPYQGRPGRARQGSSWLELAPFCRENRAISRAKLPIPSQNTATLGEALYSQRQTTHICFLTVGIAPTGTERTGSLLSPLPCDCKLCAEQCVANTILPGLSWALVDTWSVCPSPDQPKSPHVSRAAMQNVLPGSPASHSLQSCLSEPPRWTQSAGGSSP